MNKEHHTVDITEHYGNYSPPFSVKELIVDLLGGISPQYLQGLQAVVLSSSSGLNRKSRRQKTLSRNRKVALSDCRGLYNQKWRSSPATIQLFVDKIIESQPRWTFRIPLFRRMAFGEVLFHELGHHIHRTTAPEHREKEDVAEEWSNKLSREYMAKRYRCLKLMKPLLKIIFFPLRKVIRNLESKRKKPI